MSSSFWVRFSVQYATLYVDDLLVTSNHVPTSPSNVSPSDNATGVSLTPILQSSAFSDPDSGDSHAASQWQVRAINGSYSSYIWDSGTTTSNLTSITVPSYKLAYNSTYYWHVRHQDNHGDWSDWSAETTFTTAVSSPTDTTPPSAVTDLATTTATSNSVTLT